MCETFLTPGDISFQANRLDCILLYVLLRSLLCAHVNFTDVLNFNPYNNFFPKPVLLFLWSAWLFLLLWMRFVSLNAQGIRDFQERKAIFTWIEKQKADSAILHETEFL